MEQFGIFIAMVFKQIYTWDKIKENYTDTQKWVQVKTAENWIRSVVLLTVLYQCQFSGFDMQYHFIRRHP